ncbi:MAG: MFS transporter [Kiritimatiellae bacterium]|nr:MFS transporter [Kiritimatiellia bacterium]MDD5521430.1 MFS transporter [Kiritimatiellia bacterium]
MSWELYILLSVMMFLEYAAWGAWSPVLAARLLGPLKMTGKQTGWIYGTLFLAFIVSPLIAGQIADRWIATQWVLAVSSILGGILLFVAARKTTFGSLFGVMFVYSLFFAATVPLVNSLMFTQLGKVYPDAAGVGAASGKIFLWAPIAWVLAGLLLTGWRQIKGTGDGSDCLKFAGIISIIMGVFCCFLPNTPPPGTGSDALPFLKAFSLIKKPDFLVFLIVSFVLASQLQFYYLGTAQFLGDIGVESKNIPAVMSWAQVVQTIATPLALGYCINVLGFRWTLTIGVISWLLMYLAYAATKPKWLVILSMGFHGIAYVLFIIGGQIYVNAVAPADISGSAQALLSVVAMGLGFLLGTQFTGIIMDKFRKDEKFQWRPIYLTPCTLTFVCVIVLLCFFSGVIAK